MGYWETLYGGDIIGAVLAVYTDVLGAWAYFLPAITLVAALYIKQENATIPLAVGALLGVGMVSLLPPEFARVGVLLVALAVVGGLWKLLRD